LLPQTLCIATCTAKTKATLLTLEASAFLQLFGSDANLLAEMQIKLLRNGCTLKSCLQHLRCRPLFEKHIEGEYSGENIKFYDAVAEHVAQMAKPDASADELKAATLALVSEYVVDGSPQQVNIPSHMQKKIIQWKNDDGSAADCLPLMLQAQTEIYTLMARDNFPRFIKSQAFSELLAELGSYDWSVASLVSNNDLTMLVSDGEGIAQANLAA